MPVRFELIFLPYREMGYSSPVTDCCTSKPHAVKTTMPPYGSNPNTVNEVWPPTYTLPFATVGTVNFTAAPDAPEPLTGLLKSKLETLEAS